METRSDVESDESDESVVCLDDEDEKPRPRSSSDSDGPPTLTKGALRCTVYGFRI